MSTDHNGGMSMSRTLSIREAAVQAGVTEKTIRRWIKGSRLLAIKAGNQYQIDAAELARAIADQGLDTGQDRVVDIAHSGQETRVDTGRPVQGTGPAASTQDVQTRPDTLQAPRVDTGHVSVDLTPLAGVIERQGDQIVALGKQLQELTEAATAWQFRAIRAEEQLKQLTAGDIPATSPENDASRGQGEAQGAQAAPDTSQSPQGTTARSWWRRLVGG